MTQINGKYNGNLRCELSHPSNSIIRTDAPKDNQGEGMFFSPSDLLAASLVSCMITIIGIRARDKEIEIGEPEFSVIKKMASNPRKMARLEVKIRFQVEINAKDREYLEYEGKNCPVALSLSDSIDQRVSFEYA